MAERTPTALEGGIQPITELFSLSLGGATQWISIRGADRRKPLLLFLHGGPGMPLISVSPRYFRILERRFVVVNWDQRGSGLSWGAEVPDGPDAVGQYVSDALELTRYLLNRFSREKLFLVGHSWGSALGTLAAKTHPEYYYAYLGAGQVANMAENERIQYRDLLEHAQAEEKPALLQRLQKLGEPPYDDAERSTLLRTEFTLLHRDEFHAQGRYKKRVLKTALRSPEYRLTDLSRYLGAHLHSVRDLWPKLVDIDLFQLASTMELPCFYVLGQHDIVVLPELSEQYISALQAPHKELIWFDSGHSMQYEAPVLFQQTIQDRFTPLVRP